MPFSRVFEKVVSEQLILLWLILICCWSQTLVPLEALYCEKSLSFICVRLVLCHFLFYSDSNLCSYLGLFDLFPVRLHGSLPFPHCLYLICVCQIILCLSVNASAIFCLLVQTASSFTEFKKYIFHNYLCFGDYHVLLVCLLLLFFFSFWERVCKLNMESYVWASLLFYKL